MTAVVDLFGPFASTSTIACDGTPVWSGSVAATASVLTAYMTTTFYPHRSGRLHLPGADRQHLADSRLAGYVRRGSGDNARVREAEREDTGQQLAGEPGRAAQRHGGRQSGSGAFHLTVTVQLFGPFENRGGINCSGSPVGAVKVQADGDGTYKTQPVTLGKVGYYTFRESIPAGSASAAFTGKCAETAETTLVSAKPTVTTAVSDDVVRPGAGLSDEIQVSGLGQTEAAVQVALYGPFATKAAIKCTGKPYSQTVVTANGDGSFRSPPVRIAQAGFYTFHETLVARPNVAGATTSCADTTETSLGAPAIITGRGDATHVVAVRASPAGAPVRIQVPTLGIDALAVVARWGAGARIDLVIDVKHGVLGVPADIHKTGWWADSATPVDSTGTVLIAGHVDSAAGGAGAFFPLKQARPGTLIEVTTASGQTKTYKVTSVKAMLKEDLPTTIWSQEGKNKLVVVTCGGPFDQATGHYRDSTVVVTAVRA